MCSMWQSCILLVFYGKWWLKLMHQNSLNGIILLRFTDGVCGMVGKKGEEKFQTVASGIAVWSQHCSLMATLLFSGNIDVDWQYFKAALLLDGNILVRWQLLFLFSIALQWQHCCMMATLLFSGNTAVWWEHCCLMATLLFDGSTAVWWQHCSLMATLLCDDKTAVWWQHWVDCFTEHF